MCPNKKKKEVMAMKKSPWRVLLVLAACVGLCAALVSVSAADPSPEPVYTIDEPYEYPVLPGTDEWKELTSFQEMIAACHVDEELLASMTTPALLETVLNYPLLVNVYCFNSLEQGMDSVSQYFKGIELLAAREDAADCLQEYRQSQARSQERNPAAIEIYLDMLTGYLNPEEASVPEDSDAEQSKAVEPRSTVVTPAGNALPNEYVESDRTWEYYNLTEENALVLQNQLFSDYPQLTVVSNPKPAYNCHSYAWHSTDINNRYWIYRGGAKKYMSDGSYSKKTSAMVGYKVFWESDDHSAIVVTMAGGPSNPTVRSKWGMLGVYTHAQNYCPYSGYVSYWSR